MNKLFCFVSLHTGILYCLSTGVAEQRHGERTRRSPRHVLGVPHGAVAHPVAGLLLPAHGRDHGEYSMATGVAAQLFLQW